MVCKETQPQILDIDMWESREEHLDISSLEEVLGALHVIHIPLQVCLLLSRLPQLLCLLGSLHQNPLNHAPTETHDIEGPARADTVVLDFLPL